jgi:hypothetical protein
MDKVGFFSSNYVYCTRRQSAAPPLHIMKMPRDMFTPPSGFLSQWWTEATVDDDDDFGPLRQGGFVTKFNLS